MYILYLDDSGSTGNQQEDYFVLGGVCVPEWSTRWLSHQVEQVAAAAAGPASHSVEMHAVEIFGGRKPPWNAIPDKEQRRNILRQMLCVLRQARPDVVVFACAVHKASFPDQDPVQLAFEELSNRFNQFLHRHGKDSEHDAKGLIVLDKSSYEHSLQNLAASFRRDGNRWGSQLRNLCEVPLFVDSQASRNIQLADHIAYAVYRRYNAADLTYFNCIEDRFDRLGAGGPIQGLVHYHRLPHICTCPACLTAGHPGELAKDPRPALPGRLVYRGGRRASRTADP